MSKFEVLQSNQRFLSLICAFDAKNKSKCIKSTRKFFTAVPVQMISFVLLVNLLSWSVKMCKNSYDFTARLTAASITIAICQAATIFLNNGMNMQKSSALNQTLQTIVDGQGDCMSFSVNFAQNLIEFFPICSWKWSNSECLLVCRAKISKIHANHCHNVYYLWSICIHTSDFLYDLLHVLWKFRCIHVASTARNVHSVWCKNSLRLVCSIVHVDVYGHRVFVVCFFWHNVFYGLLHLHWCDLYAFRDGHANCSSKHRTKRKCRWNQCPNAQRDSHPCSD